MIPLPATARLAMTVNTVLACNVYITAGGHVSHRSALLALLKHTQSQCARRNDIAVVHAYTDTVYNRTSFHFVGASQHIATVVTDLVVRVLNEPSFHDAESAKIEVKHSAHPTVGLVDHIAVMPMEYIKETDHDQNTTDQVSVSFNSPDSHLHGSPEAKDDTLTAFRPSTPSGLAAREIGEKLRQHKQTVYFYGSAHPCNVSLATVRREKTSFFDRNNPQTTKIRSIVTVGAPPSFVENYNIRVCCSWSTAISLTKRIRKPGMVEALTLKYGHEQYEVACNLLRPNIAPASSIQAIADEWEAAQGGKLVVCGYRVGTTIDQCLEALSAVEEDRSKYDEQIALRLNEYLSRLLV